MILLLLFQNLLNTVKNIKKLNFENNGVINKDTI